MSPSGVRVSPFGILAVTLTVIIILYQVSSRLSVVTENDSQSANEYKQSEVSLRSLLIAGIAVAERGGDEVRRIRSLSNLKEESKGKTKEGANDPLTLGDRMSHQAMSRTFTQGFPKVQLISEEKDGKPFDMRIYPLPKYNPDVTKHVREDDEIVPIEAVTVWIDPLDATQEYTENLTEYVTTMACIAVNGQPTIGIIHKPFTRQTFWGWVGHGTNFKAKDAENSDEIRIIVSRSHAGDVKKTAQTAFGKGVVVIPAGGAGFKSLALYEGKASVYLHTTRIKKWDICAGNAILDATGGKMTTLSGEGIDYSGKSDPKNDGGLIAARRDHEKYLKKLGQ